MFTGIVEELGEVAEIRPGRIAVRGPKVTSDAAFGDSIAVNGVCLTVAALTGDQFEADVMDETYKRTAVGQLQVGDPVNLERAATLQTRLGGHLVQGHVDGIGEILKREPAAEWETVYFRLPSGLAKYVVEKGSIAIDGTSLTVAWIDGDEFAVGLIPTTLESTTLGRKQPGAPVHIETDVTAKHLEKLLAARSEGTPQ
ncbi:riboflavin synthase [Natronoglycomyces albus]|uniref:Riboflavin synthase n=1 Tax=Natronoglycomyces albus TaxID=2811108 RepID=A0A895XTK1_9ACTN|nr:riboflavin synthase [Natronoglycomyces albus]QSB06629.1 riboflavin synthase [Natronoglycomyces albus]